MFLDLWDVQSLLPLVTQLLKGSDFLNHTLWKWCQEYQYLSQMAGFSISFFLPGFLRDPNRTKTWPSPSYTVSCMTLFVYLLANKSYIIKA